MGNYKLFGHQQDALDFLVERDGVGGLFHDPGTGKTYTTLAYVEREAERLGSMRVLVIAPLVAVDQWVFQTQDFLAGQDLDVRAEVLEANSTQGKALRLMLMEKMPPESAPVWWQVREGAPKVVIATVSTSAFSRKNKGTLALMKSIEAWAPDLIVVDEAHMLRGATSHTSKNIGALSGMAERRIALTGTPMPTGRLNLYGLFRFLAPEAFWNQVTKKMISFSVYRQRYAIMGGFQGKQVVGYRNKAQLDATVAKHTHAVSKRDVLDLPPVTDAPVLVHLTASEQKKYDAMKKHLLIELENGEITADNQLVKMLRLRQITSGIHRPDEGPAYIEDSSKLDAVVELCTETLAGENRIVIGANYTLEIEMLAALLGKTHTVLKISGRTPKPERLRLRQQFKDVEGHPEPTIIVAQIRTLSMAVNELVVANHGIMVSITDKRDDFQQFRDRLDRQGQTRPVTWWNVMVKDSIDEQILKAHQGRADVENALLNYIKGSR